MLSRTPTKPRDDKTTQRPSPAADVGRYLPVLRVTRYECRTPLLMNMDRSYEADRNPSAVVTATLACSPSRFCSTET